MPYLFLLFIVMPILEIALLIQVGQSIGAGLTILIVILTALLGTAMLKRQGMATLAKAQSRMQSGEMPAQQLLEGLLLVIGGVLLLTPGFVTDAFGFLCLIPSTREYLARQLARRSVGNIGVFMGGGPSASRPSYGPPGTNSSSENAGNRSRPPNSASQDGDIVDGEYREID